MSAHPPRTSRHNSPPWQLCELPKKDYWGTPFAESLLGQLDLSAGAVILDVMCGQGLPAFYFAHRVGPPGRVTAIDINEAHLRRARAFQGPHFPWLEFRSADVRNLPNDLGKFDRITGNLAFMFFRPNRLKTLQQLVQFLKPGGQIVLTFPSRGTFDSLWKRIDEEMISLALTQERQALADYVRDRPSADEARRWLNECRLERIKVTESPLVVETGAGNEFLLHPLLRSGFLDDVFECFPDEEVAENFMQAISQDIKSFEPLVAQRCVMSGWRPKVSS
jgi:SAM-dependent methyltransferase